MNKALVLAAALLPNVPAFAQSVQQSGSVSRGHVPYWVTSGVIADGGSSASPVISSIGILNNGSCGFGIYSASVGSGNYQQLCLGTTTAGGATISLQNFGTAPSGSLSFVVNGISYPFPGSLSQLIINTTPVVGGNTGNCLYVNGAVVGQQTCAASSITQLTGDVTAVGPGSVPATLATVNGNVGTFGSAAVVPLVTVNGKGLITAISNATIAIPGTQLTGTVLASNIVTSSLTTVGTIGTGVWQGTIVSPTFGGTGINNGASTLTLAANLVTTGAGAPTLAFPSSPFSYTFQASSDIMVGRGTTDTLTNKTLTTPTINGAALSGTFSGTPAFSGANFLTYANIAQAAAATLIGNPTASLANQSAFTIQGTTDISSPNTTLDWIPIYNHTTGTIEKVNASELTSAVGSGVTSIDAKSGTFTTSNGIDSTAGNIIELTAARRTLPALTNLTTGTYTPAGAPLYIDFTGCGGGAGGGGNGPNAGSQTNGTVGNNTTIIPTGSAYTLTGNGGGAGLLGNGSTPGLPSTGGAATQGDINAPGEGGSSGSTSGGLVGGRGGGSAFRNGAGPANNPNGSVSGGINAAASSGGGGSGAPPVTAVGQSGSGGAGGGCFFKRDSAPVATYAITIGGTAAGGTAGAGGSSGGIGAAGWAIAEAHYGS